MAEAYSHNGPLEAQKTGAQARLSLFQLSGAENMQTRCMALYGAPMPCLRMWGLH